MIRLPSRDHSVRRVLLRLFDAQQRYKIFLQPPGILLAISKSVKNIAAFDTECSITGQP